MFMSVHRGGGGFVTNQPQPLNNLTILGFQIFQSSIFPLQRSGLCLYRSAIDVHGIAATPDHRFLWCACSRCLFLSVCLNVSVDLQQSDSTVVPLPSPSQQSCGPSCFSAFSHQPVLHSTCWLHVFQCRSCTCMPICCGTPVCVSI